MHYKCSYDTISRCRSHGIPALFHSVCIQGSPSGEAFIQMDSERSAESSALTKNKKLMFVAGHRRYVEVIQCSGDEMAVVLQHGLPAPPLSSLSQSVMPTAFWSLPPPPAATPSTDLPLLLQQRSAIPLPSAPGIDRYYTQ